MIFGRIGRAADNYGMHLHSVIVSLNRGQRVLINQYHGHHVQAFLKSKLVTRDGNEFRLTSAGRSLALWLAKG